MLWKKPDLEYLETENNQNWRMKPWAKQIETGSKPLVKVPENIVDSYIIAELELKEKKIPFIIRRPIPSGGCEYWYLRDLENIGF